MPKTKEQINEHPEVVRKYVMKFLKRMPENKEEIDQYLDLINHMKLYVESRQVHDAIGARMAKRLGFKTPIEIWNDCDRQFNGA